MEPVSRLEPVGRFFKILFYLAVIMFGIGALAAFLSAV